MAKKVLVIDGFIDSWEFSKKLVRNFLSAAGKEPVEIQLSSLGGSVAHAIDIYNQFQDHGDVTVIMSSFNASSSTLLALGAKRTVMHSNSFYLIHKPMVGVMAWANMNTDDIDQFIAKLDKDKKFLEKLSAELTRMYMVKTGKASKEIVDLMNQARWLNAKEALAWGFIDEIIEPENAMNLLEDDRAVAMLTENDLPVPVMQVNPPIVEDPSPILIIDDTQVESLWTRLVGRIQSLINPQNHKSEMKTFNLLNKVLAVSSLESTDEKGVYLNEAQLQAIEDRLTAVDRSDLDRQQAETALNEANEALSAIDTTVAAATTIAEKVTAIKAVVARKPGVQPAQPKPAQDPAQDSTDWEKIDNLPHNREYDEMN